MKSVVADYRYRVVCLRIVPAYGSGTIIRITEYPRDLVMANGEVYKPDSGYQFTGITAGSGAGAASIDLTGILTQSGVSREDVASGVYDNARIYLFATKWTSPVEDEEPLVLGLLGKTQIDDDRYSAEIMSAVDVLGQSVGATYTPNCRKRFGGQEFGGCGVNLGPLTVSGILTSVTGAAAFADSARAEAADYFSAGLVRFTSGANSGLKGQEIRAFAAGGAITLLEPFPFIPQVGDAYELEPGCRKRLADCQAWSNSARFGGFPHVPTESTYSQIGSPP